MSENLTTPSIISIHALLAESDAQVSKVMDVLQAISIHALLAESDSLNLPSRPMDKFLSTLSLRRATPRGGYCYLDNIISIHALLAESDHIVKSTTAFGDRFLSTLSLRRATVKACRQPAYHTGFLSTLSLRRATTTLPVLFCKSIISIHALLAESDRQSWPRPH